MKGIKCSKCKKEFSWLKLVMVKDEPMGLCDKCYAKLVKGITTTR